MNVETFATILSALGGFEFLKWAINRFAFRKQEHIKASSEAKKSSVDTEKAIRDMYEDTISEMRNEYTSRIEELGLSNKELNEYNLELIKASSKKDDIIEDKTAQIRKLQDSLVLKEREIGELEKKLLYYKSWFCKREFGLGKRECNRREPAQNPPIKYYPLEEINPT